MADTDEVVLESKATAEQQAAAEAIGWIPPTRFKGDVERFVDADEYIKRGETVLPIVKEQNKRLTGELAATKAETTRLAAALKAAEEAIALIEERHTVATQRAVEQARKDLKAQLAQASEAGDHAAIAEITDQMTQLGAAEEEAGPLKKEATPAPYVPPADLVEWNKENTWFGTDKRKTSLALGIAQELRDGGETEQGKAFYDLVRVEMDKFLAPTKEEVRGDKVSGARNGDDSEPRHNGKKSFAYLPADARAACDADARKFVGTKPNQYKDLATWRARYADIYFGMES